MRWYRSKLIGLLLLICLPGLSSAFAAPAPQQAQVQEPAAPAADLLQLEQLGAIEGTVVAADDAANISFEGLIAQARLFGEVVAEAPLRDDGVFLIKGLQPGGYMLHLVDRSGTEVELVSDPFVQLPAEVAMRVQLRANLASMTTSQPPSLATALPHPQAVTLAAASCERATGTSVISGTVTAAGTGLPIEDVLVVAYTIYGDSISSDRTDAAGHYQIDDLAGGNYYIYFDTLYSDSPYASEWYDNAPSGATATPVTVPEAGVTDGIDAELAEGGRFSGTVTAAGGGPIENVQIYIYRNNAYVGFGRTDAAGNYTTVPGLPPGSYTLFFDSPFGTAYLSEYYNNQPDRSSATPITISGPGLVDIDVELEAGGRIRGRITGSDTGGAGISGAYVEVYDSNGNYFGDTSTDSTGIYTTNFGLPTGTYLVQFRSPFFDGYLSEYYNDKPDRASADPVSVTAPDITDNIDAELALGGAISGTITVEDAGPPSPSITVEVYDTDGRQVTRETIYYPGAYTIEGLPSGSYYVRFRASNHLPEYYTDAADRSTATLVDVTAPNVTPNIDVDLSKGAAISGRVTAADTGDGLYGVSIDVYDQNGRRVASGYTDTSGNYTTSSELPSGAYRVEFEAQYSTTPACAYLGEYYNDKGSLGEGDLVNVTAPSVTPNINAVLTRGTLITGKVTGADTSTGLDDIDVAVYDAQGNLVASGDTGFAGYYFTRPALPAGTYYVEFEPRGDSNGYLPEFYNDQAALGTADPVVIAAPGEKSGVDAVLARGARISGRVTAADTGTGLDDVSVRVYDSSGDTVEYANTDSAGNYTTDALPNGTYRVRFYAPYNSVYTGEFYNNQATLEAADPVVISTSSDVTGIDAALDRGSLISGRVTSANGGAPIEDVSITIYDSMGEEVSWGYTNASGDYIAYPALPSGVYRAKFETLYTSDPYITEYYNDKPSLDTADSIVVNAPTNVNDINAVLSRGSSISGTITDAVSGQPLGEIQIVIYNSAGEEVAWGYTYNDGSYTTYPGLPSGNYAVRFLPYSTGPSSEYVAEYYDDVVTRADATPVNVTAPTNVTGIDAALSKGARFAGRVTVPTPAGVAVAADGSGLADVIVNVYADNGEVLASGTTNELGYYTTGPSVRPGSYRIGFIPPAESGYGPTFYNGKPDFDSADLVEVSAPGLIDDINITILRVYYLSMVISNS